MNILDKTIAYFAPSIAANRAKSRMVLNAYEAALPNRTHKAKRASQSANQNIQRGGLSLREQARFLDENHDMVIGIFDKLEERVIGSKGIYVDPQPLNLDGSVNTELAEQIRKLWSEWSIRPDVTGRFTRPQLERMLLRTWLRDGEVFLHLVRGKVASLTYPTAIPFALEALEPDFVPLHSNEQDEHIVQGIKLNAWRKAVAYQVFYENPLESKNSYAKTKLINADEMLHLAFIKRLHQVRGVSMLHGVMVRLADLKNYEESERVAARIAAAVAMYIRKDPTAFDNLDNATPQHREIELEPGLIIDDLLPGEEIGMLNSNRPNTALEAFRNGQIRAVAAGTRNSYSSIAKDYNGTYSSQRQELVESYEGYQVLQDNFVAQISRPVYREWLKMVIAAQLLKIPKTIDESSLFNAVYSGPVMPWIDPVKEVNAWAEKVRSGFATESDAIRATGANPAETKQRRKAEVDKNKELGLKFSTDLTNSTQAEQKGSTQLEEPIKEEE